MRTNQEKKLIQAFRELSDEQRDTALAFIEFLNLRKAEAVPAVPQFPLAIPRPAEESVVKALKRLRETYPMLNMDQLLHEASGHMQKHVLQGKPAPEVIDDLEAMFAKHFEVYRGAGK